MDITFWGVRGSTPCHTPETLRYGGATTCLSVTADSGHLIILDAGSGISELGYKLAERPEGGSCTILLSHSHLDHVCGLPTFRPLYDPKWTVTLCASAHVGGGDAGTATVPEAILDRVFDPALFPVAWRRLPCRLQLLTLDMEQTYTMHGVTVRCAPASHSAGGTAFRLESDENSLFFSGDHEIGEAPDLNSPLYTLMRGVDLAIVDAQYSAEEYAQRHGWGHSAMEQWPPFVEQLGIGHLVLTHFDPTHEDFWLDSMTDSLRMAFPAVASRINLAHTGLKLCVEAPTNPRIPLQSACPCCVVADELSHLTDTSQIFDALLLKMRTATHADAGTLYLIEDDQLVFAYSQNETLFTESQWMRQQYLKSSLPVDASSIAGFVALHGVTLNIDDVRHLPDGVPYTFNDRFDTATGYRTVSMCVMPLLALDGKRLGVVQLINSMENSTVVPFSGYRQNLAERLCVVGAQAVERGLLVRNMILRMLQAATLRDPNETGGHVMRVGAMVAELYHHWAEQNGVDIGLIRHNKAQLRLASMLHDVGKVGVSDLILKKSGKLTPEERREIERHCAMGAHLFDDAHFDMDLLARDIALHHHQKWDGTGYTGDSTIPTLKGEDIPLGARMTAIADVFDALISPRSYKEPWPLERVLALLEKDKGTHFDPELVDSFLEIQDIVVAIRAKYTD